MDLLEPLQEKGKVVFPVEKSYGKNTYWMFTILIQSRVRDEVILELEKRGIETRPVFTPMHMQPIYSVKGVKNIDYPVSWGISCCGINLPSSNGLTDVEIRFVCDALKEIL
jgi:perosamine synthetase